MAYAAASPQPHVPPSQQALRLTRHALTALQRGDRLSAERLLRRALKLDPGLSAAWLWLGSLQQGARRGICLRWAQLLEPDAALPALDQLRRHRKRDRPRKLPLRRAVLNGGIALVLLLGGFEAAYASRTYPGVQALGVSLSGLPQQELTALLAERVAAWQATPMVLAVGEAQWGIPLGAVGSFDAERIAAAAYEHGRSGGLIERLVDQGRGLLGSQAVTPPLNEAAALQLIEQLAGVAEQQPAPARFVRDEGGWRIEAQRDGLLLDREAAYAQLVSAWNAHSWEARPESLIVSVPLEPAAASPTAAELAALLPTLQRQTAQPLELRWSGGTRQVPREQLLSLTRLPAQGAPFAVEEAQLQQLVAGLAAEIDVAPRPSQLLREGERVRGLEPAVSGLQLDRQATAALVRTALERGEPLPELPVSTIAPPPGEAEQLGLVAVIAEGRSSFVSYSSPDRDQNVLVGGQQFDGLLVPPGGIISAGQTIGEISWERGYRWGDMISGGVVQPSLGGGICQVSTTLFRAAFSAGLEIVERHNHSWRLPWYEDDAPPGMDATIALGGPDLKIRNNTGHHLLLEVETDLTNKTQVFRLYGTPPGWQVEQLGPTWEGGAVVIGRRISRDGVVLHEDRFASYYSQ